MKIATYATDYNNSNLKLLQDKLPIILIDNYIPWTGDFYAKTYGFSRFIQDLPDEEIVVFSDAYDVLPLNNCNLASLEDAINKYFDLHKITFNAETNCYPDYSLASKYPNSESKWRYLNAGLYCGRAKYLKKLLDQVLPRIVGSDDQLQFSIAFIEMPHLVTLDYKCNVFQTLYDGHVGGNINMDDFIFQGKQIVNKHFNTTPLLFHGNGKINMRNLEVLI